MTRFQLTCNLLVPDLVLFVFVLILSWHCAIEMTVHCIKANGQCFLFGTIYEKRRIFENPYRHVCWLYLIIQYILGVCGIYFAWKTLHSPNLSWISKFRFQKIIYSCIVTSLLASAVFSAGFYSVCNTLEYSPVCNQEVVFNLEFKYFSPKYLDGNYFYEQYERVLISGWLSNLCWMVAVVINRYKGKL